MSKITSVALLTALLLSACAKGSDEITASYISPITYQNYSCSQLSAEAQRVSAEASKMSGVQDDKASSDAVATTVAVVLFWPAAFLVKGDGQTAAELSKLKGQFNAIEQASIQKKCGLNFKKTAKA